MTSTEYRDQVAQLAKTNLTKAKEVAEKISEPWFEAQAWSHLVRHADKPLPFAKKAAKAASHARDAYQRSAVRAWEVAALGERGLKAQARRSLTEALEIGVGVEPISSRAESLFLLFQAAFKISDEDARATGQILRDACSSNHWRAERARKNVDMMLDGQLLPRGFFW